jgi:hypothetical protein
MKETMKLSSFSVAPAGRHERTVQSTWRVLHQQMANEHLGWSIETLFRHGLPCPPIPTSAEIEAIARALTGDRTDTRQLVTTKRLTEAQLELLRVRGIRRKLMASLDFENCGPRDLQQLIALDRYKRIALVKRRRVGLEF